MTRMLSLLDRVACSLLWSADAAARPIRSGCRVASPTSGQHTPGPEWQPAAATLEQWLAAIGVDDAKSRASWLRGEALGVMRRAKAAGVAVVAVDAPEYPLALREIPDPPPVLWVKGELLPDEHAVAIVGSRAATPHAIEVAFRLGEGLARAGIAVVSGLARGVDAAAHRGALEGGGRTIAVLGSGVDIVYPPEHDGLAGLVAGSGAVISELVPGTRPRGWHFPRRNRIISGLSAGVVVVEASSRSGSLITAGKALDQGRAVMAVPGGVLSGRNRGAHGLLRDGARVVESVEDILDELHYVGAPMFTPGHSGSAGSTHPPQDPILWAMKAGEPYDVGFLCEQTGVETVKVLSRLAELELGGWVTRAGGGRFVRLGSNVLR
jgi:DNA processing protein